MAPPLLLSSFPSPHLQLYQDLHVIIGIEFAISSIYSCAGQSPRGPEYVVQEQEGRSSSTWEGHFSVVGVSSIKTLLITRYTMPPAWLNVQDFYLYRGGSIFQTADCSMLDSRLDCLPPAAQSSAKCQPAAGALCSFLAWYWQLLSSECPAANGLNDESTSSHGCASIAFEILQ